MNSAATGQRQHQPGTWGTAETAASRSVKPARTTDDDSEAQPRNLALEAYETEEFMPPIRFKAASALASQSGLGPAGTTFAP